MANPKPAKSLNSIIVLNKKARRDYFILSKYEAGLVLEGWELKSIRAGRVQINASYIVLHKTEAFVSSMTISPLPSVSTHLTPDPSRNRKCLLHRYELDRLVGAVERKGLTLIPLALYWKRGRIKLEIGLAKGKKKHDKREYDKEQDWKRQKQRLLKTSKAHL